MKEVKCIILIIIAACVILNCGGGGGGGGIAGTETGKPIVAGAIIKGQLTYSETSQGAIARAIKKASSKTKNVKVQLENSILSTYSDTEGNFEIKNVPPGKHTISAEYSDEIKVRVSDIEVTADAGKDIGQKELHTTGQVIGKAKLADADTKAGITVIIPGTKYSTVTNSGGIFKIKDVPVTVDKNGNTISSPYDIVASYPGYEPVKIGNVIVRPARANHMIDTEFILSPASQTGGLTGSIVLSDTTNYSGVTVSVKGTSYSGSTNSSGVYTISSIPPGVYKIEALKSGYSSVMVGNVPVDPGKTNTVNTLFLNKELGEDFDGDGIPDAVDTDDDNDGFTDAEETAAGTNPKNPYSYPTGNITGYIKPASSDALIYVQLNGIMQGFDLIDDNGYYSITDLPAGNYTITVKATGYDKAETSGINVLLGKTTAVNEITLSPTSKTGSIIGKALLYNQSEHSNITLTVQGTTVQENTNSAGDFTLSGISEGYHIIAITKSGYQEKIIYNALTLGDDTVYLEDITLIPLGGTGGTLIGTVILESAADNGGAMVMLQGTSKVAITDSSGSYTISGIPGGDTVYVVSVTKQNYNDTNAGITITSMQTSTLDFYMTKITIADMDGDGIADHLDPDKDGDGVLNADDAFPDSSAEWSDLDGDGIGDNSDLDIDGDGYINSSDSFPRNSKEWIDTDNDGTGDNADNDDDNDGFTDLEENVYGSKPKDSNSTCSDILSLGTEDTAVNRNYLFDVNLYAKGVTDLKIIYVKIYFDSTKLTYISDTQGPFLSSNNGSVFYISEQSGSYIEINTSVGGGSPRGVSGSGILSTIKFAALAVTDNTEISILTYSLTDTGYNNITATKVNLAVKINSN